MTTRIHCQGLPCPQPVLLTKQIIEKAHPASLEVVVDNDAAKENVTRFMTKQGYTVTNTPLNGNTMVVGVRDNECEACQIMSDEALSEIGNTSKTLVFISADTMGTGDDTLGAKLMVSFLGSLKEFGPQLWRIVLVNSGVKLTIENSPCLAPLQELAQSGVSILVCGTCLDHFGLLQQKQVGDTTNMLDIITSFQLAGKVIRV